RLIVAAGVLFPLIAAFELVQPFLVKIAIDDHILRADWAGLTGVAALFLAALAVLATLRAVEAYLMNLTGHRVRHDRLAALFRHLLRLDATFYDTYAVGRLMTRVLNDVEAVNEAFTSGLFAVIGDVVTLVAVVGAMLWLDWRLALVTFSLVPVLAAGAGWVRVQGAGRRRLRRGPPAARPPQRVPPGVDPGHGGNPALRPRGPRAHDVSPAQRRLPAHALPLDDLGGVALRVRGGPRLGRA